MSVISQLQALGYTELTEQTPETGKSVHMVYILCDEDNRKPHFYPYETNSVRSSFYRFKMYLAKGATKWLPVPIGRLCAFSNIDNPGHHVKAFYLKHAPADVQAACLTKLSKIARLAQKIHCDTPGQFTVYKLGIKGRPEFKIVVSKANPQRTTKEFIATTRKTARGAVLPNTMKLREWAIAHYDSITQENVTCEVLYPEMFKGPAHAAKQLYCEKYPSEYVLN